MEGWQTQKRTEREPLDVAWCAEGKTTTTFCALEKIGV